MRLHSNRVQLVLASAVFALTALFSAPISAHAVTTANFSVAPFSTSKTGRSIFIYDIAAGSTLTDSLVITNHSEIDRTFALYPSDGSATETGGAFALSTPDPRTGEMPEQRDVGSWIQIPATEVQLPAKQSVVVSFTLRVPNLARVGDHAGGILVVDKTPNDQAVLQTNVGIGARMYIAVTGQRLPALRIGSIDFIDSTYSNWAPIRGVQSTHVRVKVSNDGNTRLYPSLDFIVRDSLNRVVARQRLEGAAELGAGNSTYVIADFSGLKSFGSGVTVEVTATDGDVIAKGSANDHATPWLLFLMIALASGFLISRLLRKQKSEMAASEK